MPTVSTVGSASPVRVSLPFSVTSMLRMWAPMVGCAVALSLCAATAAPARFGCAVGLSLWAATASATSSRLAGSNVGLMAKFTASTLVRRMFMTMSMLEEMPSGKVALPMSGMLHTAIRSPSSSNSPASRTVKPPTLDGTTVFTAIMLGDASLMVLLAISPVQTSLTSAVASVVGM